MGSGFEWFVETANFVSPLGVLEKWCYREEKGKSKLLGEDLFMKERAFIQRRIWLWRFCKFGHWAF